MNASSDGPGRTLNHFALFQWTEAYTRLPAQDKQRLHETWLGALGQAAEALHLYQVSPTAPRADLLIWSAVTAADARVPADFFAAFTRATAPWSHLVRLTDTLWGFTKPSVYTRGRSPQEIDPFGGQRAPYLIVYPFVKTQPWYLMSRDARQGMMNEHIKLGKQFPSIQQLLLYSVGLQDQEFVVCYETEDLTVFSDLVYQLRSTEVRRFTERDTPLTTALYRRPEEALALWT